MFLVFNVRRANRNVGSVDTELQFYNLNILFFYFFLVSLTKAKKKGLELKTGLVKEVGTHQC